MPGLAYLFERFPSFSQTFCYREVAELQRQGLEPVIFSIRRPRNESPQNWDREIVRRVQYLPEDEELEREIERALRKKRLPESVTKEIETWGRKTDFLRLYQAAWLGTRLRDRGVRHVHAHFAGMAARTAWWIERFFALGFSFTAHANDIFAPRPFEVSLGKLIGASRAVVTVSDFSVQFLRKKFPEEADKISRIYNGIDLEQFRVADFSATIPTILSIGRLIEKKGFSDLIVACHILHARELDFRCEIIGEGPLEETLQREIASSALTNKVILTGPLPQEEVVARLARSVVFALPCVEETAGGMDNLPTVIMEAMATGLPVISTPISGVPEMVVHNQTGLLVPEHQPTAVAEAIAQLLSDRKLARSLGQNGRDRTAALFDLRTTVASLHDLFTRLSVGT